jgi:hypothetical protein
MYELIMITLRAMLSLLIIIALEIIIIASILSLMNVLVNGLPVQIGRLYLALISIISLLVIIKME